MTTPAAIHAFYLTVLVTLIAGAAGTPSSAC
jgi:hypothetical protein